MYVNDPFVAFQVPTVSEWNQLWENDASFNDGSGIANGAITPAKRSGGFKVGTFTVTGNGSKVVTGVGFQPKALYVMLVDSLHVSDSVANMSFGFTDGTTSVSTGFRAAEGGDISGTRSTTLFGYLAGGSADIKNELTITSFDADGFTLSCADWTANTTFGYLAIG